MYFVPEGQHDRSHSTRYRLLMASLARSAWESLDRENRPVGYGMIEHSYPRHTKSISRRRWAPYCRIRNFVTRIFELASAGANQTVPYGTALLGGAFPGTSCQATIAPSLRDEIHSQRRGLS
jgi:hypothetical protein